jgi:hypothetical protein
MTVYWLLVSGCALSAWLTGYGIGYLRGARDAANTRNGELAFSGDRSDEEI